MPTLWRRVRVCDRLEGQADDLPASLTPEKFVKIIPEKEPDLLRMLANLYGIELFQIIHRTNKYSTVDDILETCVKVFDLGESQVAWHNLSRYCGRV
ncbi:MAG: hypothetical protein ABSD99_03720 [Candidatus Bathyarchaeia archaeon]|jgi:hypothetical protein